MQTFSIAVLPGDGIGPEIINEAVKVVAAVGERRNIKFNFKKAIVGGTAYERFSNPLPQETVDICLKSDAILFGANGGPKWDYLPKELRPEQALLKLRKTLGLYINNRPIYTFPQLVDRSPIRREILKNGVDFIILRELSSGLYYGEPKMKLSEEAVDTMRYTKKEIRRLVKHGFELARLRNKRLTVVDKANVLETSRLWREVVISMQSEYCDIDVDFMYVDNCTMQLLIKPHQFDVIVTENTFGDIISDEASALTGSIGMLPSASLGDGNIGLYEPIHGSAPDIAGKNIANPIATIMSAAMMLDSSFDLEEESLFIREAVNNVLEKGLRTPDIADENSKVISTTQMGDAIVQEIKEGNFPKN